MTGRGRASVGSTLLGVWSRWWSLFGWGRSLAGRLAARCVGRTAGLSPATRDRVVDLIEGDLDCLIEDASAKPTAEQSVEEMLVNRELLLWLRGGPLPGQRAVELLEENVAVFYRAPADEEKANGKALRAALDALVRARATARPTGSSAGVAEAVGLSERERRCFGKRLDELRRART
jgi:hypothetical protein